MKTMLSLSPLLVVALLGCGAPATEAAGTSASNSGKADEATPLCGALCDGPAPEWPGLDDARYVLGETKIWHLIGDGLTPDDDAFTAEVAVPEGVEDVVAWVDEVPYLLANDGAQRALQLDISALDAGSYEVLFAERGAVAAFASRTFTRSYPLYVFVSIDWDGPDPPDANLRRQERLHEQHPELLLTHLVGPYTFTAGLPEPRVQTITDWLRSMRDDHGDEIGLHIHPYCHFVESAGVTCRRDPTFYQVEEARAGYTVFLYAYEEAEMRALLVRAKELFVAHDLGVPTTFRAGAWAAQSHTLRALDAEGFVADGSAVNWPLLEEWEGDGPLFGWLRDNWGPIDGLSQPYYPGASNAVAPDATSLGLLEIPDNGALVDYVRADEMIAVLESNLGSGALHRPRVVSIGYHVDNFSESYFDRMTGALRFVDERLAAEDAGPVVYARMSELPSVAWEVF